MKIIKIICFATGLLLMLSLGSCDRDNDNSHSAKRLLPSKIIHIMKDSNAPDPLVIFTSYSFEYDVNNRISEIRLEHIFNRKLSEVNQEFDRTVLYTYSYEESGIMVDIIHSDPEYSQTISYVRKGSVVEVADSRWGDNVINIDHKSRSTYYTYNTYGNVEYEGGTLLYDKKNGIFRYVNMPPWYMVHSIIDAPLKFNIKNNCVKCIDENYGYAFEIQYNINNYPVEMDKNFENSWGILEGYQIEYIDAN